MPFLVMFAHTALTQVPNRTHPGVERENVGCTPPTMKEEMHVLLNG